MIVPRSIRAAVSSCPVRNISSPDRTSLR
jgi:hypothetical protein